jgi:hypothetical protein
MKLGLRGFECNELGAAVESEKSSNYKVDHIWIDKWHLIGENFNSQHLQTKKQIVCISSDDFSHKPIQTRICKVQYEK